MFGYISSECPRVLMATNMETACHQGCDGKRSPVTAFSTPSILLQTFVVNTIDYFCFLPSCYLQFQNVREDEKELEGGEWARNGEPKFFFHQPQNYPIMWPEKKRETNVCQYSSLKWDSDVISYEVKQVTTHENHPYKFSKTILINAPCTF